MPDEKKVTIKPRPVNSWMAALKVYNAGKAGWCMPRKGSPEYNQVKAIQDKIKAEPGTRIRESRHMITEDVDAPKPLPKKKEAPKKPESETKARKGQPAKKERKSQSIIL